ncbi:hypothetical protein DFH29DRAFT_879328 [Suillus ampliporus]|nr:hypothetical protein DFH29DRAFT_879328 [Suillus ampliporus]
MSSLNTSSSWNSVVNVFGDVIFLDITNAVSLNSTYCFNLNIDTTGTKKIVFRIRERVEEAVESDESVNDPNSPQPVIASLCNLLTRRTGNPDPDPANPTVPWSYYSGSKKVWEYNRAIGTCLNASHPGLNLRYAVWESDVMERRYGYSSLVTR